MTGDALRVSLDERREALARAIHRHSIDGWRVASQTETTAALVRGRRPNHLLHLVLTVLTFGLWAIAWLVVSVRGGEEHRFISVDEHGALGRRITQTDRTSILDEQIAKFTKVGWKVESRSGVDARLVNRRLFGLTTHRYYVGVSESGELVHDDPLVPAAHSGTSRRIVIGVCVAIAVIYVAAVAFDNIA